MKPFIAIIIFISFSNNDINIHHGNKKIIIYYIDQKINYGMAPDARSFWKLNDHMKSITVAKENICNEILLNFKNLKDTTQEQMFHAYAFISYNSNSSLPVDTFYTDPSFKWWVLKGRSYFMSSNYFQQKYSYLSNF